MFNPVLFELGGVLLADQYLLGQHCWSSPVTLLTALLVCQPPSAGILTIGLEIGGVLSGDVFTVDAASDLQQTLPLNRLVPANTYVRWKITGFTGATEEAATASSITITL